MNKAVWARVGLASAGLALMLGASACSDPAATAKAEAEAEAEAKAEATAKEAKLREKVAHNVECLNALKWQQAALAGAGIGDLAIYNTYYRENIENALAGSSLENPAPAPTLSIATIDDYLAWSYPEAVKTAFTAGKDTNGDGKLSANERSGQGFSTVANCVQEVAERGRGPLAGKDKVGRVFKIQAVRAKLKDKDA